MGRPAEGCSYDQQFQFQLIIAAASGQRHAEQVGVLNQQQQRHWREAASSQISLAGRQSGQASHPAAGRGQPSHPPSPANRR